MTGSSKTGPLETDHVTIRRRAVRWLAAALGCVVVIELAALIVASISTGGFCAYSCHQERRSSLLAGSTAGELVEAVESVGDVEARPWVIKLMDQQAIHPFLGIVSNPDRQDPWFVEGMNMEAAEHGFVGNVHSLFQTASEQDLTVVVIGGSVAHEISQAGRVALETAIAQIPRYSGREVRVLCLAVGGYKAPQPFLSLAYMLSLGLHADLVILVDGLNDIALAAKDNVPFGVHPAYPRLWHQRVAELDDGEMMTRGEARFVGQQRRRLARAMGTAPWRYSLTLQALWTFADRRLESWFDERLEKIELPRAGENFTALGPPFELPEADPERALALETVALWERSARQLHALAAGNDFELYHFLQPNQYDGRKPLSEWELTHAFDERSPFKPPVELAYPMLRERGAVLRRDGINFHDLSSLFEETSEAIYRDKCCHFNHRGRERLAEAIAELIAADHLSQETVSAAAGR